MSFYLRKAFRLGPVRFNLSKSGLGVSAGVTGARVGLTSQGRAYVHAGRGGVYMRHYIGSGVRVETQDAGLRHSEEPIVLYEDTGVTYAAPEERPDRTVIQRLRVSDRKQATGVYAGLAAAGALLVVAGLASAGALALTAEVLGAAALVAGAGLAWRAGSRNRARGALRQALGRALAAGRMDDAAVAAVRAAADDARLSAADREVEYRKAYLTAAIRTVDDGKVEDAELALLDGLRRQGNVEPEFVRDAHQDAFRAAYLGAVADHVLTQEEERTLDHVRQQLGVAADDLKPEMAVLERLEQLRAIREGRLPAVVPSVPLEKHETCRYEAVGRLLKEKNLRTFQREGQKYHVRGLVVQREGTLFITDKRVLLVYEGTYSVPIAKVLHVQVDVDRNLIQITKDGAATPTLLATPDAVLAGALVAELAGL
ncbi:MAG TPA: DUF4236 domain-containing protein [Longimicrobiales bacterium]|nr:DUF4236 domain-containing protein [Longimicrobiales bacterium]